MDFVPNTSPNTEQLSIGLRNLNFRANIASTLVCLNPDNRTTTNSNEVNGYEILSHLFGLGE